MSRKIRQTIFLQRSKDAYIFKDAQLIGSGNGEMFVKKYKLPDTELMSSGNLTSNMVIIVKNAELYT